MRNKENNLINSKSINKNHMKEYILLIQLEQSGILEEYLKNKDKILLYLEEVSQ